jgi:glycosyltransferase involved in cell wall biosynthesis
VWCEWALGNVQWYSHAIEPGTPLFVRYHLQERNYEFLNDSKQEAISNLAFVCQHYEESARAIGQIQKTTKTSVIPNTMNIRGSYPRKNDNYSIGFVGMVPARKRIDLALDLLEELLQHDLRYKLKVVGKNPEEYDWLMKRDDERKYYETIRTRLESNPHLKSRVEFLGFVDDIREFYSSVGHVISTSDFESYHLTLADGPVHGAAAHSLRWDGADSIYTKSWLNETVLEIAESIRAQNDQNITAYEAEKQSHHLVPQMSPEIVALSIIQAIGGESK